MALYSFVAVVQNIANCLLLIILYIFRTHFAMNLFFCTTCKRKETMEQRPHFACEGAKSKQRQNQVMYVAFKLTTRSVVRFSPEKTQRYHKGMVSLSDIRVKRKIVYQYLTEHHVWSWRKSNFNQLKKIQRLDVQNFSNLLPHPPSLRPVTSHFCLIPTPTPPIPTLQSWRHM